MVPPQQRRRRSDSGSEGISRPKKALERELKQVMSKYDIDNSGTLDWLEFVTMFVEDSHIFKIDFSEEVKIELRKRVDSARHAMVDSEAPASPYHSGKAGAVELSPQDLYSNEHVATIQRNDSGGEVEVRHSCFDSKHTHTNIPTPPASSESP